MLYCVNTVDGYGGEDKFKLVLERQVHFLETKFGYCEFSGLS